MDSVARWRLASKSRTKGRYYWLETGRAESRRSLTLGFVSEAQANRALETMNREEELTAGTPMHGRVERLFSQDPEKAIAYLVEGEGSELDAFGSDPADYGALPLNDYFETIYKPWRSQKKPKTWASEEGCPVPPISPSSVPVRIPGSRRGMSGIAVSHPAVDSRERSWDGTHNDTVSQFCLTGRSHPHQRCFGQDGTHLTCVSHPTTYTLLASYSG